MSGSISSPVSLKGLSQATRQLEEAIPAAANGPKLKKSEIANLPEPMRPVARQAFEDAAKKNDGAVPALDVINEVQDAFDTIKRLDRNGNGTIGDVRSELDNANKNDDFKAFVRMADGLKVLGTGPSTGPKLSGSELYGKLQGQGQMMNYWGSNPSHGTPVELAKEGFGKKPFNAANIAQALGGNPATAQELPSDFLDGRLNSTLNSSDVSGPWRLSADLLQRSTDMIRDNADDFKVVKFQPPDGGSWAVAVMGRSNGDGLMAGMVLR